MEALILETNPHQEASSPLLACYNIMLRDDKTYPYQGHRPRGLSADLHDPPRRRRPRRRPLLRSFADCGRPPGLEN